MEVFRTTNNTRDGSLIAVMDASVTAAGSRLLELYLAEPILDLCEIKKIALEDENTKKQGELMSITCPYNLNGKITQ